MTHGPVSPTLTFTVTKQAEMYILLGETFLAKNIKLINLVLHQ